MSAEVVDFHGIIIHLFTSDFASLTEKPPSSHDSFLCLFMALLQQEVVIQ